MLGVNKCFSWCISPAIIAWHGTYTFTGGQCDRSFSEPWPVWFSLCFNWTQGTRVGERTCNMIFWCGSGMSCQNDSSNVFEPLIISLLVFFSSGCLGGSDWIINNTVHFVCWTWHSCFVKNEPYVRCEISVWLNKSEHLKTVQSGCNWNAVKMCFTHLTWIW